MKQAMEAADAEELRKWIFCASQVGGVYLRLLTESDFEQRLRRLEEAGQAAGVQRYGVVYEPAADIDKEMARLKADHLHKNGTPDE